MAACERGKKAWAEQAAISRRLREEGYPSEGDLDPEQIFEQTSDSCVRALPHLKAVQQILLSRFEEDRGGNVVTLGARA